MVQKMRFSHRLPAGRFRRGWMPPMKFTPGTPEGLLSLESTIVPSLSAFSMFFPSLCW